MANIDTILAADLEATAFNTDAAECPADTVSYTPAGGEAVSIPAVILQDQTIEETEPDGRGDRQFLQAAIATADVAAPAAGDSLTYNSRTFRVTEVAGSSAVRIVTAERFVNSERSMADYRRQRGS